LFFFENHFFQYFRIIKPFSSIMYTGVVCAEFHALWMKLFAGRSDYKNGQFRAKNCFYTFAPKLNFLTM
jgi:hypothetical protein